MPVAIAAIVVFGLTFTILGVVSQLRRYVELKNNLGENESSGSSMKTSELEGMMERAAKKAIRPLEKRIENLEASYVDEGIPDLLMDTETYDHSESISDRIKVTRGIENQG